MSDSEMKFREGDLVIVQLPEKLPFNAIVLGVFTDTDGQIKITVEDDNKILFTVKESELKHRKVKT